MVSHNERLALHSLSPCRSSSLLLITAETGSGFHLFGQDGSKWPSHGTGNQRWEIRRRLAQRSSSQSDEGNGAMSRSFVTWWYLERFTREIRAHSFGQSRLWVLVNEFKLLTLSNLALESLNSHLSRPFFVFCFASTFQLLCSSWTSYVGVSFRNQVSQSVPLRSQLGLSSLALLCIGKLILVSQMSSFQLLSWLSRRSIQNYANPRIHYSSHQKLSSRHSLQSLLHSRIISGLFVRPMQLRSFFWPLECRGSRIC